MFDVLLGIMNLLLGILGMLLILYLLFLLFLLKVRTARNIAWRMENLRDKEKGRK
jgi:hypothetical protein